MRLLDFYVQKGKQSDEIAVDWPVDTGTSWGLDCVRCDMSHGENMGWASPKDVFRYKQKKGYANDDAKIGSSSVPFWKLSGEWSMEQA